MDDERRDRVRTRFVRGAVLAMLALGAAAIVLSLIPSVELYRDANDCFGGPDGARRTCETAWILVDTVPAANFHSLSTYLAIVLAPALILWMWPRLWLAVAWSPWTMVATTATILSTFEPFADFAARIDKLPLAHVFDWVMVVLLLSLTLAIPVASLVIAIATRRRPPPPPVFPTARVVRG